MILCVRMEVDDSIVSDLDLVFYLCIGLELRLDERKRDEAMLIDYLFSFSSFFSFLFFCLFFDGSAILNAEYIICDWEGEE